MATNALLKGCHTPGLSCTQLCMESDIQQPKTLIYGDHYRQLSYSVAADWLIPFILLWNQLCRKCVCVCVYVCARACVGG